ncbi:MAG: SAM-dependent chlorinase/fluorinase [Bacteroidales bacterium]|nr:SAM-dependent chlorinase/fluorinase [Bacteroidales bacterium]
MQFITLISDWNSADYYIGAIKGRILSRCPEAVIVDVNHQVTSHNTVQAAFVVKNTYHNFPKGSIHIIAVNSEARKDKPLVVVKYDGHFFIGADNGLFHLMMDRPVESIVEIAGEQSVGSFPELETFAVAAANLANGVPFEKLGSKRKQVFKQLPVLAVIEEDVIIGKVVYIDSYQNIITNVGMDTFDQVGNGRTFHIYVQSKSNVISKINKTYNETSEGELLALFNSAGLLEIAIRNGKVAELFNLTTSSTIRIVFDDNKSSENDLQRSLF